MGRRAFGTEVAAGGQRLHVIVTIQVKFGLALDYEDFESRAFGVQVARETRREFDHRPVELIALGMAPHESHLRVLWRIRVRFTYDPF